LWPSGEPGIEITKILSDSVGTVTGIGSGCGSGISTDGGTEGIDADAGTEGIDADAVALEGKR